MKEKADAHDAVEASQLLEELSIDDITGEG